jgi:hypothetical protein
MIKIITVSTPGRVGTTRRPSVAPVSQLGVPHKLALPFSRSMRDWSACKLQGQGPVRLPSRLKA